MEGLFARWYDKNVQKYPEQYRMWAKKVAENVAEGSSVLEVAPGSGYLAIELAKRGTYKVVGLDISRTLVEIAQKNATKAGVGAAVEFRQEMPHTCRLTMRCSISSSVQLRSTILQTQSERCVRCAECYVHTGGL